MDGRLSRLASIKTVLDALTNDGLCHAAEVVIVEELRQYRVASSCLWIASEKVPLKHCWDERYFSQIADFK
jgi:hypothetical protein